MKRFKEGDKVLVGTKKEPAVVIRRDDFEDGPGYLVKLEAGGHATVSPGDMKLAKPKEA